MMIMIDVESRLKGLGVRLNQHLPHQQVPPIIIIPPSAHMVPLWEQQEHTRVRMAREQLVPDPTIPDRVVVVVKDRVMPDGDGRMPTHT